MKNNILDLLIYLLFMISILREGLRFPDPENEDPAVRYFLKNATRLQ